MCIFSKLAKVADTKIFARSSRGGRQFLVYSMRFSAKEDLAMILPLPVPKNAKEDALRFINLEKYSEFFRDLESGFRLTNSRGSAPLPPTHDAKLKVVEVGAFEASFVPTRKDFARLDERFRLPDGTWDQLPAYKDHGFAVFKLKPGSEHKVHPMAFEFPRADPGQLFFPTVHIHDGRVQARARFDHALYCQPDRMLMHWRETPLPARNFMKLDKAQGLIDADRHCYQKVMSGMLENTDVIV